MLQLRMVCELIGFACVVAHGDVPITRSGKFKKDYSADTIFRKLEDYHSDFFPSPVKQVRTPEGFPDFQDRSDAMTRKELEKLYHYCHDRLHRGRVGDILAWTPRHYDHPYLWQSIAKLTYLLDEHVITLSREDGVRVWVQMDAGNGKIRWNWMLFPRPV